MVVSMNNNKVNLVSAENLLNKWEFHIMAPDMEIAHHEYSYKVRHFDLWAEEIEHQILPEITLDTFGYNKKTPGPVIIMRKGEWLFLTLHNKLSVPTGLQIQGYAKPGAIKHLSDFKFNGLIIDPDDSFTYKLLCDKPGTYLYQSVLDFQVSMGLIGTLLILPDPLDVDINDIPDKDFVFLMQQWEIPDLTLGEIIPGHYKPDKYHRNPNFFTLNGRCYPYTSPIYLCDGDNVRMRFLSKAGEGSWIHLEGHQFRVLSINGFSRNNQYLNFENDTVEFNSGVRTDIAFTANNPGKWFINATAIFHQSNNGVFPGGIMSNILYF